MGKIVQELPKMHECDPSELHIDVSLIPDHTRDVLAAATLEMVRGILKQPGGREMLDAQTAKRKAQRETMSRAPA